MKKLILIVVIFRIAGACQAQTTVFTDLVEINKSSGASHFSVKRGSDYVAALGSGTSGTGLYGYLGLYHHSQTTPSMQLFANDVGSNSWVVNGNNAGNFGIGTAAPGAKLVIQGSAGGGLQSGLVQIRETTATNPSAIGFINSGNADSYNDIAWIRAVITSGSAKGALSFVTRNSDGTNIDVNERMRISSSGNVGIGTTTPAEKLSVNGKIRAHEVKVETANWPDYVFEDSYRLKPLSEVSAYIKANRHLPEVPSARDVSENGIQLGEMNAILLRKIEELTLHLIEQNKDLTVLKKEVYDLKNKRP